MVLLRNRSIFKDHPFLAARTSERPPVFLDFTVGLAQDGAAVPQLIEQIAAHLANEMDGVILSSQQLAGAGSLASKEIWVRADDTPAIHSLNGGQKGPVLPLHDEIAWVRWGVAGVVGTLLLGNAPAYEADNIQYLSYLRSHTRAAGLPLAIDLHIIAREDLGAYPDVVEMGVNLAVELDGELVFIPAGEYLRVNKNIRKIAPIPIFTRQPADSNFTAGNSPDRLKELCARADGLVFTYLWAKISQGDDPLVSQASFDKLSQPVGG
jgi:hypothetical protein